LIPKGISTYPQDEIPHNNVPRNKKRKRIGLVFLMIVMLEV
jgi:hypothetical protein